MSWTTCYQRMYDKGHDDEIDTMTIDTSRAANSPTMHISDEAVRVGDTSTGARDLLDIRPTLPLSNTLCLEAPTCLL